MTVAVLGKDIANMALVGGRHFVIISTLEGDVVVDDRCPHRGGPLRLGRRECGTGALRCPWHATVLPEKRLLQRALPGVRVRNRLHVLLPDGEGEIALTHGTVTAYAADPAGGQLLEEAGG